MEGHMARLTKYIGKGKVFIFSTKFCPYCYQAKELFDTLGVSYGSVEVERNSNDFPADFVAFLNSHAKITTYPKIYIGMECIGGYTDAEKLLKNMKLFNKLKNEGIEWIDA